jgi:hypothetical protein
MRTAHAAGFRLGNAVAFSPRCSIGSRRRSLIPSNRR